MARDGRGPCNAAAMMAHFAVLASLLAPAADALPETIKIGGLFETGDDILDLAFRYAIDRINADTNILPNSRLSAQAERLERHDSFQASRKVCDLLGEGMAAIFGPQSKESSAAVQSTCGVLEVPHIQTRWDYRARPDNHSVNLYPNPIAMGKAYLDFVKQKHWKMFAILYEDNDALIRLQELLKDPIIRQRRVIVRQFGPRQDYRTTLKELGKGNIKNFILDVATEHIHAVLKSAQEVEMMSEYHNYVITSLDLHTVNLEEFNRTGTNISGFRLVDEDAPDFQDIVIAWKSGPLAYGKKADTEAQFAKTEVALMYDAVRLFATALSTFDNQQLRIHPLSCDNETPWHYGMALVSHIREVTVRGLTGDIRLDNEGFRTDFKLKVLDFTQEGLKESGEWNQTSGFVSTANFSRNYEEISQTLKNRTLIVTSIVDTRGKWLEAEVFHRHQDPLEGHPTNAISGVFTSLRNDIDQKDNTTT